MNRKVKAFTLIEIIAAFVIFVILVGLTVPAMDSFLEVSRKRSSENHGSELYMAAYAAVDTTYSLHNTEFQGGLRSQVLYDEVDISGKKTQQRFTLKYGCLTNDSISNVQYDAESGRNFNYAAGFKRYYSKNNISVNNNNKCNAYLSKYMLQNLGALSKNITTVEERLRFAVNQSPVGSGTYPYNVESYNTLVNGRTYSAGGSRKCKQAGVVVCYGESEGKGSVIYTEYGDEDGYLVICVNPSWYYLVKDKLKDVREYDKTLTEAERKVLLSRNENNPIIVSVKNGIYEAPSF